MKKRQKTKSKSMILWYIAVLIVITPFVIFAIIDNNYKIIIGTIIGLILGLLYYPWFYRKINPGT